MSNATKILAFIGLGSLAAGGAYVILRKKPAEETEPEPEPEPEPGNPLWQVGQILVLSSGERWEILEVILGPPIAYRAKWLQAGAISTVPESNFIAAGAVIEGPAPSAVTVTLKALNPPAEAEYWAALCGSYPSCDFIPISQTITWSNIPPDTPKQWVIFGCYDAGYNALNTPNAWNGVGFSNPFTDGWTYFWDFPRGLLLDPYMNPM